MGTFNQEAWAADVEPVAPGPTLVDELGAQLAMTAMFGGVAPWVDQRFVIRKILGAGGFGMVCLAHDRIVGGDVALKLLLQGPSANVSMTTSLREATSLQRCDHPSIVRVLDARHGTLSIGARHYAVTWVAMNLVAGRDLDKWLDASPPKSAAQVVLAVLQIADALHHAHGRGVIHRDLKPSNILLEDSGRATLVDFGLALASDHESAAASGRDALGTRVTRTGETRGTPIYMAPEAAAGLPSAASDQYSLALVLREALTGAHPMLPNAAPSTAPHDGPAMANRIGDVVRRAMAGVATDRFPSMAEFAGALAIASGIGGDWRSRLGLGARDPAVGTPSSASPQERQQPSAPRGGRSRGATLVALTGIALGATGVGAYFVVKQKLQGALMGNREGADDDGRSPTTVNGALTCADLPAFAGEWSMSSAVEWTAHWKQYRYQIPYRLRISKALGCTIVANLNLTWVDDATGAAHRHRAHAIATATPRSDGALGVRIVARYGVDEIDGVTMLKRSEKNRSERDHLELRLSRIADADGKFSTRIDATAHRREVSGRDIRRIRLHPRAGADPSSAPAASEPPPCWVACDLECSGDASVASCRDRCSAALALEAPQCGAPSEDFQLPTRLHDQRQAITSSGGLGAAGELDDVCRRSQLHDEADDPCRQIVDSLTGSWTIHGLIDDDSAVTLVLGESTVGDPGSVELLVGSVTTGGRALPAVASVSNSGSWYVRAANVGTHGSLVPAFPPFLLVGGAHDSPRATAVGVTLGATARKLRATRRMAANSASAPASAGAQRPGAPLSAPASPPTVGRKTVSREPMPSSTGKPSLKPKRPPRE